MKWVIFVNNMVYPILLLPGKRVKKHDKSHKNYSHKKYKTNFVKPNDFYAKKKMFLKNMINRDQVKANVLTVVNLDTIVKIANKNLVS